jgi:hypothetical protein
MEKSSYFLEIFGNDLDAIAPEIHARRVPEIPVIDTPPELRKHSDGSARSMCRDLESRAVIDLLCPLPEPDVEASRILKTFEDAIQPDPDFIKNVMALGSERLARKARIAGGAPRRKRELREIVDQHIGGYIADHRSESDRRSQATRGDKCVLRSHHQFRREVSR